MTHPARTVTRWALLAAGFALAGVVIGFALSQDDERASAGGGNVDFSLRAGASSGAVDTCDTSGVPTAVCQVPTNGLFRVSLHLNQLPTGLLSGLYQGYDSTVQYGGVTQDGTNGSIDATPWPDCAFPGHNFQPGFVLAGCAVGVGSPGSSYTGKMLSIEFRCVADGTISLVHGTAGNGTHLVDGTFAAFAEGEGTVESLTIDCGDYILSTPTPGPPPVDFSIGTDLAHGAGSSCDSSGSPSNVCFAPKGGTFRVSFYLHKLPAGLANGKYSGYDATIQFSGVQQTGAAGVDMTVWPECDATGLSLQTNAVTAGCAVSSGSSGSTHTGRLLTVEFRCVADGEITLIHGTQGAGSDLVDGALAQFAEAQGSTESLIVYCEPPQPYPMDPDGDGCPDMREAGPSAYSGGQRNFLNPWDYFNPTHDGRNRIDDILAVVDQYFIDEGNPSYTTETDRTFIGTNAWNLGPPDGKQRTDDVVDALRQYFHDCS